MKLTGPETSAVKASGPATHRLDVETWLHDSHGQIMKLRTETVPVWHITDTKADTRTRYFYMEPDGELFYTFDPLPPERPACIHCGGELKHRSGCPANQPAEMRPPDLEVF